MKTFKSLIVVSAFLLAMSPVMAPMAQAAPVETFQSNAKSAHAKKMHQVFAYLSQGKYAAAWTEQQALENMMSSAHSAYEQALYPLYDLAKAMFMSRTTKGDITLEQDSWQAMMLVRNVYVRNTGISAANTFLADDGIGLSVDVIRSLVEKKLIADTKKQNTAEGYERLLSVLDENSTAYKDALNKYSTLEFEASCSTAQGCRQFLQNHPESPLVNNVKAKLVKYDYADAQKANNEATWKKFINNYELVPSASDYVSKASKALKTLQDSKYINSDVTLAALDEYAKVTPRSLQNPVFAIYDNLINIPIHSYRLLSAKLGFGGVIGRVEETVTDVTSGSSYKNYFIFNEQGLLIECYNGRDKTLTQYTYSFDDKYGFKPVCKKVGNTTYTYRCTYTKNGRLAKVTCTDGTDWDYWYDTDGRISKRVEHLKSGTVRTSVFKSGKIRTEQTGNVTLSFLKYDGSRATEIDSQNGGKNYVWTYDYTVDTQNRWTRATAQLDGKQRLVITRRYSQQ